MKNRIIEKDLELVEYYPRYNTSLKWYQDFDVCKQVDNRDEIYDLNLLKNMYSYLKKHGYLYYVKYKNRLCGDVCLQFDGEINIVISKPYQNKHIGRKVIKEVINIAKEKGIRKLYATIYSFNSQSQRMFLSVGFSCIGEEQYILEL